MVAYEHIQYICFLSAETYELHVPENHKLNEKIGTLELEDRDQIQNKEPIFIIPSENSKVFGVELSPNKDGNLMLKQVGGSWIDDISRLKVVFILNS